MRWKQLPVSHANMQYVSVFSFFLWQGRVSRPKPLGPCIEVEGQASDRNIR